MIYRMQYAAKTLLEIKPQRVLIRDNGHAVTLREALHIGHEPVVVWVRNDGWMLAAPMGLEIAARNIWHDQWVGVWTLSSGPNAAFEYSDLTGENKLATREEDAE